MKLHVLELIALAFYMFNSNGYIVTTKPCNALWLNIFFANLVLVSWVACYLLMEF